jgi:5'-nucleotidase
MKLPLRMPTALFLSLVAATISTAALTGCGGSNVSLPSFVNVTGVAATGAAMVNADVQVKCINSMLAANTKTGLDGSFSVTASGGFPCLVEVSDGQRRLHSVANSSSRLAVANVTPLTEQLLASLSQDSADTAAFFARFDNSLAASVSADKITAAQVLVLQNLKVNGLDVSQIRNLITDVLVAKSDFIQGNDYDKLLDSIAVKPVSVRIIAMNDFHGNFQPPSSTNGGTLVLPNGGAGQTVAVGGAAYLATVVKNLKSEIPNSILVGAGDLIGASPFASLVTHDEASVDILNNIGLETSSVGNHEFDSGQAELLRIQNGGCFPAAGNQGAIGSDTCLVDGKFPGAKYKYLSANVVFTDSGKPLLASTYIKRFGTVSVGFIGLTFQATPNAVSAGGIVGLTFSEESAVINKFAAKMKSDGVSAVVVLIHQGGQTTAGTINDKTCPGFSGDILGVADKLSSNVDIVVSGHTHQEYVCNYFGKVANKNLLLTSTGYYGGAVSAIDLTLQPSKGVTAMTANTVPVIRADLLGNVALPNGFTAVAKDPAIDALVTKYSTLSTTLATKQVGTITQSINRALLSGSGTPTRDETAEGALGDLMADSYLAGVSAGADMAFVNPGSVRADLTFAGSGAVTYAALNTVEPFGNTLFTHNLTGAQIVRLLEQQWEAPNNTAKTNPSSGAVGRLLQVSKGLTYSYDNNQAAGAAAGSGNRLVAGSLKLNGVMIDSAKSYRVVTNSFLAAGGDNFAVMATGTNPLDTKTNDLVAFINFFATNSPVSPPAPRITRIN